jgi:hypothetical protein
VWTRPITIANFPNPQNVAGTVDVGNLPAVQEVTGTVAVANLPAGPQQFQFVGVTAATFTGDKGVGTFTVACQQDFLGSRMCTSREILLTTDWPPQPPSFYVAWVQPTLVPFQSGSTGTGVQDISGLNDGTLSCGGWFSLSRGLLLHSDPANGKYGAFIVEPCSTVASVTCCAPVE